MLTRVFEKLGITSKEETQQNSLQAATAALMVQVCVSDGDYSAEEEAVLKQSLQTHFDIAEADALELLERAKRDQADATCLYAFTRAIAKELDNSDRQTVIRLLWQVAFADGTLDNFEANVIAKVAGLLGVSPADRVQLKQEVETEL